MAALEHQQSAPRAIHGRYDDAEMARFLAALVEGLRDAEIVERLGISLRGVNRRVSQGMEDAGARTRFHWGYIVGRNEGRSGA